MSSAAKMRQAGRKLWADRLLTGNREVIVEWMCKYLDAPSPRLPSEVDSDFYEGLQQAIISSKKFAFDACGAFAASTSPHVIGTFMDMLELLWKHDQDKARELFKKVQINALAKEEVRRSIDDYLQGALPQDFRVFLEHSRP